MTLPSHLLAAFSGSPWYLHQDVHANLCELLDAHANGTKASLQTLPLAFMRDSDDQEPPADERLADWSDRGVAVIDIRGVLAMHADQINGECQPQGRSYAMISSQIAAAQADPSINAIVLRLETPGGAASGCQEVYDQIAASSKPVHAFISHYCFSAGMYLASACGSITASSRASNCGSIGTIAATWDTSEAAEKRGVKRVVARAGAYKALMQDGERITDAARAEMQREVDAYAAAFYDAVRAGRGLDDAQALAVLNGRTFMASEAMALGLVDAIEPLQSLITRLATTEQTPMFSKKPAPAAALTLAEAAQPIEGLTKAEFADLASRFPESLAEITAADVAGKPAAEIVSELMTAQAAKLRDQVSALKTENAAQATELATLRAQAAQFKSWTGSVGAAGDPGSDAAAATPAGAAAVQAAWKNDQSIRDQFALGGIESYVEHLRLSGAITMGECNSILADLKTATAE